MQEMGVLHRKCGVVFGRPLRLVAAKFMVYLKQLAFVHSPRIGIKSYTICPYAERSLSFSVY